MIKEGFLCQVWFDSSNMYVKRISDGKLTTFSEVHLTRKTMIFEPTDAVVEEVVTLRYETSQD